MDISSVNSDLIRGNVTTIILGCLREQDKYGYEILKEIEDKSHSQYALKQATLYNQLKRLEKQGLVSSYDGAPDDTGGGKRRYYALTVEGKNYLKKEKGEYEYARTILDKLVSDKEFDFTNDIPFDASELRPYSKRGDGEEKTKIVYKDKVVEVEKTVEVEKRIYIDRFGNPLTAEEAENAARQALIEDEETRKVQYELDRTLAELSQLKEEREDIESKLAALAQEKTESDEQLHAIEDEKSDLKSQMQSLEDQKALLENKLTSLEEQQDSSSEQVRELEDKLDALQSEKEELEEKLRTLEDEKLDMNAQIANLEEDKAALEEDLQISEDSRVIAEDQLARLQEERRIEEESKREELRKPSATMEELFAKIEAKSEYNRSQRALDEQTPLEAVAADLTAQEMLESEIQSSSRNVDDSPLFTSATVSQKDGGFDYEKGNVNYKEFFSSITEQPRLDDYVEPAKQTQYADADIKTRLYAKGFKIRPYDKGNTSEYYTFNFIQSNRINRDTFLIVLALFLVEMAVMWVSLATRISYVYFLTITLVGASLCLIPTVLYLLNPTKRIRANFNFKLSVLNRTMLFIELTVVCILIGFFALGASVNDIDLILCSMIIPAIILLDLPISSIIYWLLYRTRKYHIA